MAKIVTITNPLTGQPAQVDQLDHTAQQIDDGLNIARGVSNPNLLDNWYFANPVNQRGQTEYNRIGVGAAYTIDRWMLQYATLTLHDGMLTWGNTQTSGAAILQQRIEGTELCGKTLTFSVMHADGTVESVTGVMPTTATSVVIGYFRTETSGVAVQVRFAYEANNNQCMVYMRRDSTPFSMSIKAAKLELGTQQTLAHQDSSGKWVLNELPNYADTLARCQSVLFCPTLNAPAYTVLGIGYASSSTEIDISIPFPVSMRSGTATVSVSGDPLALYRGGASAITALTFDTTVKLSQGVAMAHITTSGLTVGAMYVLATKATNSKLLISCEI